MLGQSAANRDAHTDIASSNVYPQSELLCIMKLRHRLGVVPMDGNCFYHACAELMRIRLGTIMDHVQVRRIVCNTLSTDERSLVNEVDVTGSGWADHIEIYKFATEFNIRVVVCDDDHGSITVHGPKDAQDTFVLQLYQCHFVPVFCRSAQLAELLALFRNHDCVSKDALQQLLRDGRKLLVTRALTFLYKSMLRICR